MDKTVLRKALMEAAVWDKNLTKRQRSEIPFGQARTERIDEILEELLDPTKKLVTLKMAMALKEAGFNKKTEYYYQDKDVSFSPKGLKKCKSSKTLNHNAYDDFVYSAPTKVMGLAWLNAKK